MAEALLGGQAATRNAVRALQPWRGYEPMLRLELLLLDTLMLAVAFVAAYVARFHNPWLPYYGPSIDVEYLRLTVWIIPVYLVIFAFHRLYDTHVLFGGTKEYSAVVNACTIGMAAIIIYTFFDRHSEAMVSRGWLLSAWLLSMGTVGISRFCFRRLVYRRRKRGRLLARTLILGTNQEAKAVAEQLRANLSAGLQVVGFAGENIAIGSPVLDGLVVLGNDADVTALIRDLSIHEIIIAPTALSRERLLKVQAAVGALPNVHLRLSSGLFEMLTTGVQVRDVGNVPLISLNRVRLTGIDAMLKAGLDYSLTLLALALLALPMLAIAVLVKRSSPGPVLHRRRVMGVGGARFDALKFRTMVENADQALADLLADNPDIKREYDAGHKLKDDPRITPLGAILRRYSLDELPQLLNVLVGQMSLVGPRMIAPEELCRYGNWSTNLLTVKPGITGPWQVMGRNDLPYEERVRLSMGYIRNYSIWTDIKILLDTIGVVVHGRGAY